MVADGSTRRFPRSLTRRTWLAGLALILSCAGGTIAVWWDDWFEKRVVVVEPGGLVRGAWQRPSPLRALLEREGIRSIVTLTAINPDDPKYVDQAGVLAETEQPIRWIRLDWRGSTATLEQMAEAADLLADRSLRPIFFHCVAGHHRTGLAHAAYRIRHCGYNATRAWEELRRFPWTNPDHPRDQADRELIRQFEAWNAAQSDSSLGQPETKAATMVWNGSATGGEDQP